MEEGKRADITAVVKYEIRTVTEESMLLRQEMKTVRQECDMKIEAMRLFFWFSEKEFFFSLLESQTIQNFDKFCLARHICIFGVETVVLFVAFF